MKTPIAPRKPKHFELVKREHEGKPFYAARALPLGLTAYGGTKEEAVERLKTMFGLWVDSNVRRFGEQSRVKED
ncbi:unnamed protein product [marine sediment metagenome]|uniref:HicB-like antitoxin of toxin-antitoxin system domain-containing protein n=1 Tax=marine sediment metagenome TaxID=412755 RepID=X0S1I5_9ZZZZ